MGSVSDPAWPFSWRRPISSYDTDGPLLKAGDEHRETVEGVEFVLVGTGATGIHTGRDRFQVTCVRCGMELHARTTGPSHHIRWHLRERHGSTSPI